MAPMLIAHAMLLGWGAWIHSPTHCEVQQLPAGLATLYFGRFDLAQVNPPLLRLLAALPVAALSPRTDWQHYSTTHIDRADYATGVDFIQANGQMVQPLFFAARLVCILFSVAGGYVCYRWARELYSGASGLIAASLWCFSPCVLGHGQLVSADLASASVGGAFAYAAWRWLRRPTWRMATVVGLALGAAELMKFTCLVFYPLLLFWWLLMRRTHAEPGPKANRAQQSGLQLVFALGLSLYVINMGYAFEGTPTQLGKHVLFSQPFRIAGVSRAAHIEKSALARLAGTIPIPLPEDYIKGVDAQKAYIDNDSLCYLRGQWRLGGWWYYYVYALACKTPMGTIGLFVIALAFVFTARWFTWHESVSWRDELVLLSAIVTVIAAVRSQTSLNVHLRYAFLVLPFLFIWCAKVGMAFEFGSRSLARLAAGLVTWSIASSLWFYPHDLSYFNELVGGPKNGHRHLLFSNIDWGQDLFLLRNWLRKHPEARPLGLSSATLYNPAFLGIEWVAPPKLGVSTASAEGGHLSSGPEPGWYAVSVNDLHLPEGMYDYFLEFDPVDSAGYSIYIYHVTLPQANRVRRKLNLPELPADWEQRKKRNEESRERIVDSVLRAMPVSGGRAAPIRVGLFHMTYDGAGNGDLELKRIVEAERTCSCRLITCEDINKCGLDEYDVFLAPGGSGSLMAEALGPLGAESVRRYVEHGGGYVGICAGAFLATENYLNLVEAAPLTSEFEVPVRGKVSMADRGDGNVMMQLTAGGKRVLGGPAGLLGVQYAGGPIFSMSESADFPKYAILATYRSDVARYDRQRGTMVQTPAAIAALFGQGRVVLFGPHPESTKELECLVRNAVTATARRSQFVDAR